ncbi:MAG: hypothetical protein ABMA64_18240 [Myxococcota bacterium]
MMLFVWTLAGCSTIEPLSGDGEAPDCASATYPTGVVEPMTEGEVLAPYRWPVAVDRTSGARVPLDLANVPCDADPNFDWSRTRALLFVSIPAW